MSGSDAPHRCATDPADWPPLTAWERAIVRQFSAALTLGGAASVIAQRPAVVHACAVELVGRDPRFAELVLEALDVAVAKERAEAARVDGP